MKHNGLWIPVLLGVWVAGAAVGWAQAPAPPPTVPAPAPPAGAATAGARPTPVPAIEVPSDYVIGPDDVLRIEFWRDSDLSATVTVRPDGKVTFPLLQDVQAAGLRPDQLSTRLSELAVARNLYDSPNVMVRVENIRSRFVHIVGEVVKVGPIPINGPITVIQAIGLAGGFKDFADTKNIKIIRKENGRETMFRFNYKDVMDGKNLRQNIDLKPGDTVLVPS